jgi:putative hydrolase of the HAD superfamily
MEETIWAVVRYLFFDFFGTLVRYDHEIRDARISRATDFVRNLGSTADGADVARELTAIWHILEAEAKQTLREPHWHVAAAQLLRRFGLPSEQATVAGFTDAYMADWCTGIEPVDGLRAMLVRLGIPAAIVTNTYYPPLVPEQLELLGLGDLFQTVTTSVEHGFRKPHPTIYQRALASAGVRPCDALFVGDNPECDYRGPRNVGLQALAVSPVPLAGVPEEHRLAHILDLERWLCGPLAGASGERA